jgi:hypothetical protein
VWTFVVLGNLCGSTAAKSLVCSSLKSGFKLNQWDDRIRDKVVKRFDALTISSRVSAVCIDI